LICPWIVVTAMRVDRGRRDVSGDTVGIHKWVVLLEPVDNLPPAECRWHGRHSIYEKFSYWTVVDHLQRLNLLEPVTLVHINPVVCLPPCRAARNWISTGRQWPEPHRWSGTI